ncbi:hypothetical protein, partial [Pantoea ananatis]|uniref:hypothetical protein n=1 Tax=Pantoea ananas TaxID=553 RepID=UPI0021F7FEC6
DQRQGIGINNCHDECPLIRKSESGIWPAALSPSILLSPALVETLILRVVFLLFCRKNLSLCC